MPHRANTKYDTVWQCDIALEFHAHFILRDHPMSGRQLDIPMTVSDSYASSDRRRNGIENSKCFDN